MVKKEQNYVHVVFECPPWIHENLFLDTAALGSLYKLFVSNWGGFGGFREEARQIPNAKSREF